MAFKMRSGNKTTFKNMGSSPLKQEDDGLVDVTKNITANTEKSRVKQLEEEDAYKQTIADKKAQALASTPWNKDVKEATATLDNKGKGEDSAKQTDTGKGGYDYGEERFSDKNISRYKTKEQIRQDNKDRKLKSKSFDSEGGDKYTKTEKHSDKINKLADKYQRARGEGSYGLKFDWKNMLAGDSVASGFSIERKQDIVADKISRLTKKKRDAELRKTRKSARKDRKAYNSYIKNLSLGSQGDISFDEWKKSIKDK